MTFVVVAGPISDAAVDALAAGIFAKPNPLVVEAYSEPDQEPLEFTSADTLAAYLKKNISKPSGLAFVFLTYPDMGGRPIRRTIHLDPQRCPGQTLRYTWDGWGLISVQLYGRERASSSRVASNSKARANAWTSTYPNWSPPNAWNWRAVESHTRRLTRILRKVT